MLPNTRFRLSRLAFLAVVAAALVAVCVPDPAAARSQRLVVSGEVTTMQGEPIPEARISLHDAESGDELESSETGAEGRFRLELRGEPGTYRIRVAAEGYRAMEDEASLAAEGRAELSVQLVSDSEAAPQEAVDAYNAAVVALQAGDADLAMEKLDEAVAADPDLPEPFLARAQIHLGAERPAEAAAQVEVYLEARPDDENARRLAYEAYRRLDDQEGMERQIASLADTDAAASIAADVYNQGVAAYRGGDREAALEKLARALEIHPELAPARIATASILFERKGYLEALEILEPVLEEDPGHLEALEMRFLAFEALDSPEAEDALRAWSDAAPDEVAEKLSEWAEEDFEADRLEDAEKNLSRLLELRPDRPETHHRLGLVFAASGDATRAKEHLRRFVELAPDHPEAESARAMIEAL